MIGVVIGAAPLLICSKFPVLQIFICSLGAGELQALRERVFDAACIDDIPRADLSLIGHAAGHRLAACAAVFEAAEEAARGFEYWCARSAGVDDVLLVRAARSFLK